MPEGAVTGTFGDYSESNTNASEHPSIYETCQQSGFKAKPEELIQQWDGAWVRRAFVDRRHPQEFVRGLRERMQFPSGPPELVDAFIVHSDFILTEDGRNLAAETRGPLKTEEPTNHLNAGDL
jgi:hypothetical protein